MLRLKSDLEKSKGIVFCWNLNYSFLLYRRILECLRNSLVNIQIIYRNHSDLKQIKAYLKQYQLPVNDYEFLEYPFSGIWIRDYFPICVQNEQHAEAWLDFNYNKKQTRPNDDAFGKWYLGQSHKKNQAWPINMAGGNLITDGNGIAVCTNLVLEENKITPEEWTKSVRKVLGINQNIILKRPKFEHTGHIDMLMKFIGQDKILTATVPKEMEDYELLESNIQEVVSKMPGFEVIRINIAPDQNSYKSLGNVFYSYVNAIILDDIILIPLFGEKTDNQAIALYERLFPTKKIHGIYCKDLFQLKGGLHCMIAQY